MSKKKHDYNSHYNTLCGQDVNKVSVVIDSGKTTCKHCLKILLARQVIAVDRYAKRLKKAQEKRCFYFEKLRTTK